MNGRLPSRAVVRSARRVPQRAGFTLVELLIVMVMVGILANIAVPAYRDVIVRADAAHVIADFTTIRLAAYQNFANVNTYPGNGRFGQVPLAFADDLPDGFKFTYKDVDYRWRRWAGPNGQPGNARLQVLFGVEIRTRNAPLLARIQKQYEGYQAFGRSDRIVLVIE